MESLETIGKKAKEASRYAAKLSTNDKNAAICACADALDAECSYLLAENKKDMDMLSPEKSALKDRLLLNNERVLKFTNGMRDVAAQDDPVGETLYMKTRPSGLQVGERRVPLGVVAIIYEARPEVTADAFALCLKSGNSLILRGGSEAIHSNIATVSIIQKTLSKMGHPPELAQILTDTSRETAVKLMKLNKYVDVLFPRGGGGLIQTVVENANMPVIETGVGNCHIYVDDAADFKSAVKVVVNAKISRPSVCNACETVLVHQSIAGEFIPMVGEELHNKKVEIRGDETVCRLFPKAVPATEEDWHKEFLDMIIAIKVVDGMDEAMEHIEFYGTHHSDAIITENYSNALRFVNEVDSAAVYVNASTRFTDGGEFGLGAEVGISTQKLHARGPMGLKALTCTKFVVFGNGNIR